MNVNSISMVKYFIDLALTQKQIIEFNCGEMFSNSISVGHLPLPLPLSLSVSLSLTFIPSGLLVSTAAAPTL